MTLARDVLRFEPNSARVCVPRPKYEPFPPQTPPDARIVPGSADTPRGLPRRLGARITNRPTQTPPRAPSGKGIRAIHWRRTATPCKNGTVDSRRERLGTKVPNPLEPELAPRAGAAIHATPGRPATKRAEPPHKRRYRQRAEWRRSTRISSPTQRGNR